MLDQLRKEPGRGRIALRALCVALLFGSTLLPEPDEASATLNLSDAPAVPSSLRLPVIDIHVVPPSEGALRWSVETAGHLAALLEANLADYPTLLPNVVGAPPRRGIARAPGRGPSWQLTLETYLESELRVQTTICPPAAGEDRAGGRWGATSLDCTSFQDFGSRLHPEGVAERIATAVTRQMGLPRRSRGPAPSRASPDDYAVLMLGRSAATVFGLLPAPPPETRGDPQQDPVHRAVFVDPNMDLAWSLLARVTEDPVAREAALARTEGRPSDLAERASALDEAGQRAEAWAAWRAYDRRQPADPRFAFARAAAAAAVGDRAAVVETLGAVPTAALADPAAMILIDVALAEGAGRLDDRLLEKWQDLAPADPRPPRLRIERFLAAGRHAEALALTEVLAARGAEAEARRLTLALASHLGDAERAADAARALGRDEVARRLELAASPREDTAPLYDGATSPEARLQGALHWLTEGEPRKALAEARELLAERPWWPAALEAEGRAWAALGRAGRSYRAQYRQRHADPLGVTVAGDAASPLAPSVADVDASHGRVAELLGQAEDTDAAWSRLQQEWVELGCARWACRRQDGAPLAAALRNAARRARRHTQSARAEWARAERMQAFDAVRPLLGHERAARRDQLHARIRRSTRRYAARLAWNADQVDGWARTFARAVAPLEDEGHPLTRRP